MTEYEINKAVAEKLGVKVYERSAGMLFTATKHRGEYTFTRFDPCNDVQQVWEIIYKYKIDISFGDDVHPSLKGCGMAIKGHKSVTRDKPFVAAMLCFLEI